MRTAFIVWCVTLASPALADLTPDYLTKVFSPRATDDRSTDQVYKSIRAWAPMVTDIKGSTFNHPSFQTDVSADRLTISGAERKTGVFRNDPDYTVHERLTIGYSEIQAVEVARASNGSGYYVFVSTPRGARISQDYTYCDNGRCRSTQYQGGVFGFFLKADERTARIAAQDLYDLAKGASPPSAQTADRTNSPVAATQAGTASGRTGAKLTPLDKDDIAFLKGAAPPPKPQPPSARSGNDTLALSGETQPSSASAGSSSDTSHHSALDAVRTKPAHACPEIPVEFKWAEQDVTGKFKENGCWLVDTFKVRPGGDDRLYQEASLVGTPAGCQTGGSVRLDNPTKYPAYAGLAGQTPTTKVEPNGGVAIIKGGGAYYRRTDKSCDPNQEITIMYFKED